MRTSRGASLVIITVTTGKIHHILSFVVDVFGRPSMVGSKPSAKNLTPLVTTAVLDELARHAS